VAAPAQITVLLALTANLLDSIPLDGMKAAEQPVQDAAAAAPNLAPVGAPAQAPTQAKGPS
jgi:hypothetical protein